MELHLSIIIKLTIAVIMVGLLIMAVMRMMNLG